MQADDPIRPEFASELPPQRAMPRYEIIRTPTKRRVTFLCLSETVLIMPTHWIRNRTTPCDQHHLAGGCQHESEMRWKCYVAVYAPPNGQTLILEMTDHGGESVIAAEKLYHCLRGRRITVWRSGTKDNSPVNALISPSIDPTVACPPCPDVKAFLLRMWYVRDPREENTAAAVSDSKPEFHPTNRITGDASANGQHKPRRKGSH